MSQSTDVDAAAQHDLIFYVNRNTPKVVPKGSSPGKVPEGYGAQTKRRPATADEEKIIAKGGWLRVNKGGKKPGQNGYSGGSNYRPQLRNKGGDKSDDTNQTNVETDEDFMTEEAAVMGSTSKDTIYAQVGSSTPEYRRIIKVEWTAKGPVSTVVQDYKVSRDVSALIEDAMLDLADELADDDDSPEEMRLLMSAWQALAMYLSSCDDEDKEGALQALKMVSAMMNNGNDDGPSATGTFGVTTQAAAKDDKPKAKVDKNGKPLPDFLQPKVKKASGKDTASTTFECPMDKRSFSTEAGLINHLQALHNMGGNKAAKMAGAQS